MTHLPLDVSDGSRVLIKTDSIRGSDKKNWCLLLDNLGKDWDLHVL